MVKFDLRPDRYTGKPLYTQIRDYVVRQVGSGEWSAGDCLPSQRDLAGLLGVNRSTIVTAFDELQSIGIIESFGRSGTRISGLQIRPAGGFFGSDWNSCVRDDTNTLISGTMRMINEYGRRPEIIKLGSGEIAPELFPKEKMARVIRQVSKNTSCGGYGDPKGSLYLREQLCGYLRGTGIDASPERILIVSGATQGIQLVLQGLLRVDSTVLAGKPSHLYLFDLLRTAALHQMGVPMDEHGLEPGAIARLRPRSRQAILYTVPDFQNPTGILMPQERRREILDVCNAKKIPIIEDGTNHELWLDSPPPRPLMSMDRSGSVIYIGSVSKTLDPSLRVGWVVGPPPVIGRLSLLKMQMDKGTGALSQEVVGRWLETGLYQEYLPTLRTGLAVRKQAALEALNRHFKGIATWKEPAGGTCVWLKLAYPMNMKKLFHEALEQGVLLCPGYLYDTRINQCLRISYSRHGVREIKSGLKILSQIIKKTIKTDYQNYGIIG